MEEVFDAHQNLLEAKRKEGSKEGYEHGLKVGRDEGFQFAFKHGYDLPYEFGKYQGVATHHLQLCTQPNLAEKLMGLIKLIKEFRLTDNIEHDETEINNIRNKYKLVMANIRQQQESVNVEFSHKEKTASLFF